MYFHCIIDGCDLFLNKCTPQSSKSNLQMHMYTVYPPHDYLNFSNTSRLEAVKEDFAARLGKEQKFIL